MYRFTSSFVLPLIVLALIATPQRLFAQLQWNTNGSGGNGTWDAVATNWFNGTTNIAWDSNTANFVGTAGTVTMNSALSATGLTFGTSGYIISGTGTLSLTGSPTITVGTSGATAFTANVNVSLNSTPQVVVTTGATGSTTLNFGAANTFTGGIQINSVTRVNFNLAGASGTGAGAGAIRVAASGTRISNANTAAGGVITIPNAIQLNVNSLAAPFNVSLGATNTTPVTTLNYSGVISGAANVFLGNDVAAGGAGITVFSNSGNTYTGNTYVSSSTNGLFRAGANNALPTSTNLIFGVIAPGTAAAGIVDLNDFNVQVGSISTNTTSTVGGITNSSTNVRTLTIAGSGTNTYALPLGLVSNTNVTGTNNIALSLATSNTATQVLTGNNTYSGGTTISGGTLRANTTTSGSNSATGTGAITINTGGTLDGTGSALGAVTINSGGRITAGTGAVNQTLTVNSTAFGSNSIFRATVTGTGGQADNGLAGASRLAIIGAFDVQPTYNPANPAIFELSGDGASFIVGQPYTRTVATLGSMGPVISAGFGTNLTIDPNEGVNLVGVNGLQIDPTNWQIGINEGNNLLIVVRFTPVPEPATILGMSVFGALAIRLVRRRKS
jgi:fibronectin-binding autotransporter adhesin